MQYRVLGWPPDGPRLRLDHRRFAYAGKFVMSSTGKAVAFEDDPPDPGVDSYADVVAAVAVDDDRTNADACDDGDSDGDDEPNADGDALWIRYVTVREGRKGEGVGPRLCARVAEAAERRGYDVVRIAVNNVYAFHALHRAGFGYTGRETGLAELVLERPGDASRYEEGLDVFAAREVTDRERSFLESKRARGPPALLDEGDSGV